MKPILFNTDMVRAILGGRKTETRRVVKPQPNNPGFNFVANPLDFGWYDFVPGAIPKKICCPYKLDDILYVRETWNRDPFRYDKFIYRADGCYSPGMPWQPSIHMPREAARIFLRVTRVRVERLQDICGGDLLKEGIDLYQSNFVRVAFDEFASLWNSTIKPVDRARYGWAANPWVWVIEFERCEQPEIVGST